MNNGLRPYEMYKEIELPGLDKIPSHWKIIRIKQLYNEVNDRSNSGDEELLSVSQYTGVTRRRDRNQSGKNLLTNAESLIGYKKVKEHDLVMNIMLAWNGSLGSSKFEGIVSPAYCIYRLKSDENPYYFHYLYRTSLYTGMFSTQSTGIIKSRLRLYPDDFFKLVSFVPPRPEQDQIVKYLDHKLAKINKFIKAKKKLITVLKEQKEVIINEAVTKGLDPNVRMKSSGIELLGDVPVGWEKSKLKELALSIGDGLHGTPVYNGDGNYYFINGNNLGRKEVNINHKTNKVDELEYLKYKVDLDTNTILISLNGTIGSLSFYNYEPIILSKSAGYIRLKENILKLFIYYYLQNTYIKEFYKLSSAATTINNLSLENLRNTVILMPSLNEQCAIIDYLEHATQKIDKIILSIEKQINLIAEYQASLVSNVVTGKVDVRHIPINKTEELDLGEPELEEELTEEEMLDTEEGDE